MKGSFIYVFMDEVVSDVNVLGTLMEFCCCGECNCAYIVKEYIDGGLEWE